MKKTLKHNRIVEDYLRNVNQSLDCAKDMKKALISEIEQQVTDLEEKIQDITLDDLYREIGTPEEIAQGFENREDIDRIRKKAAKYKKNKVDMSDMLHFSNDYDSYFHSGHVFKRKLSFINSSE